MDARRFDRFTTTIAGRQSRRTVLKHSGMGLSVAALGATGLARAAAAQNATPSGSPVAVTERSLGFPPGERSYTMFIQTAKSGTWAPKAGEQGVYTLTLTGAPAQTINFSDRPQRIIGVQPTADFLDALGFSPKNPPNAAVVVQGDQGEDVLVIELFNPTYTEDQDGTLTYDARVLENYQDTGLTYFADRQDDLTLPASFDDPSFFIDDCADDTISCYSGVDSNGNGTGLAGTVKVGCCWSSLDCRDCGDYSNVCQNQFGTSDVYASRTGCSGY